MKKFRWPFLLIIFTLLLASCDRSASTSTHSAICRLNLQIFVRQGPHANQTVSGQVALGNSWSSFKGDFVEEGGSLHPISFYFDGQAIHFILEAEQGRIFGTGVMESTLATCSGNGGGTQSGPEPGDLGDWRGQWILEGNAIPQGQPDGNPAPSWVCLSLPMAIVVLILAIWFFRVTAPFKTRGSKITNTSKPALRRTGQGVKSEFAGAGRPVAEYLATYTAGDRLFDLSFEIESLPHYFGECGVTIAKTLDAESNQATALEIWLFSTGSSQTVSKILMSDFCHSQAIFRSEMEKKGQAVVIQAGDTIVLETKELRAMAKIMQLEYDPSYPNQKSVFKSVAIKIAVWKNPE